MDNDFGINSKLDLYERVIPALNCKKRELEKLEIKNVKKEDIWNYLLKTRWENIKGLDLAQMVDDILNLDNELLVKYLKSSNESNTSQEIELL